VSRGKLGFPKDSRLLRRPEFLAVKASGQGFAEGPLAASYRPRKGAVRVGLTVSTKVGGSVVRNQVKRRLREAVRHELGSLPAVDLVIVARASSVHAGVPEFRTWLRRACVRMRGGS